MSYPRVVPFKHPSDLAELGRRLYGPPAEQRRGLTLARAYQVKGPLPASVHATVLVLSALLNDMPQNDLYAIRQAYAMALVRLVNEVLDAQQGGKVAAPLHALARELGLPGVFVELRHAATHEDLPSVHLLRDLATRAMDWLWANFWSQNQGAGGDDSADGTPVPAAPSDATALAELAALAAPSGPGNAPSADGVKALLREWRRSRRSHAADAALTEIERAIAAHVRAAAVTDEGRAALHTVLFTRNILVPTGTQPMARRVPAALVLWGPLLAELGPDSISWLVGALLDARGQEEWPHVGEPEPRMDAYQRWLAHLLPRLEDAEALNAVLTRLAATPRPWSAQLLAAVADATGANETWALAEEMAAVTGATLPARKQKTEHGPPAAAEPDSSAAGAWQRVPNWTPRPLGT